MFGLCLTDGESQVTINLRIRRRVQWIKIGRNLTSFWMYFQFRLGSQLGAGRGIAYRQCGRSRKLVVTRLDCSASERLLRLQARWDHNVQLSNVLEETLSQKVRGKTEAKGIPQKRSGDNALCPKFHNFAPNCCFTSRKRDPAVNAVIHLIIRISVSITWNLVC